VAGLSGGAGAVTPAPPAAPPATPPATPPAALLAVVLAVVLAVAAQAWLHWALPLVADEAYYAWWGRAPALGYLDHPPAVMAWGWVGERLLWGPRALNLCLAPAAGWLLVSAAGALGVPRPGWLAAAALCTPLGLALGVLLTPDAPLVLGWALAVWGLARRRGWAGALGLALALWSKAMALPAAAGLLWAWGWRARREGAPSPWRAPLGVGLAALALYAPHLWWSSGAGWLPWSFQAGRAWGRGSAAEWALGQLWVGTPLWALWALRGGGRALSRARAGALSTREGVLLALSAPSALLWGLASLGTRVEANWSALAWPGLLMLALCEAPSAAARSRALLTGAAVTLPLALLPLLHRHLPPHLGPPRDGARLASCARAAWAAGGAAGAGGGVAGGAAGGVTAALVSGRYQEASLLWAAGEATATQLYYLRAEGRRRSELDRALARGDAGVAPPPACGFVYLGPRAWLGARCAGAAEELPGSRCATPLTACRCASLR